MTRIRASPALRSLLPVEARTPARERLCLCVRGGGGRGGVCVGVWGVGGWGGGVGVWGWGFGGLGFRARGVGRGFALEARVVGLRVQGFRGGVWIARFGFWDV